MHNSKRSDMKLFVVLFTLCLVPVLSGGARLFSIAVDGAAEPLNLNYVENPLPIALHMLAYMVFCVLGTLQIAPVFRWRHRGLHRQMGRMLIPVGCVAAIAGIWMTLMYPPVPSNGVTVGYVRIAFGAGMILCLVLGTAAVRRRDIPAHQIWMMRSYAIAMGASTQALVAIPWFVVIGQPQGAPWAFAMFVVWVFNLAVAEWFVKRPAHSGRAA